MYPLILFLIYSLPLTHSALQPLLASPGLFHVCQPFPLTGMPFIRYLFDQLPSSALVQVPLPLRALSSLLYLLVQIAQNPQAVQSLLSCSIFLFFYNVIIYLFLSFLRHKYVGNGDLYILCTDISRRQNQYVCGRLTHTKHYLYIHK